MSDAHAGERPRIVLGYPAPSDHFERLARIAPGFELVRVSSVEEAQLAVRDATVYLGNRYFLQALPHAARLRWMQSSSVGMDLILEHELARRHAFVLTAARGVYDDELADHAVALLYALVRDLPGALALRGTGAWTRRPLPHLARRLVLVFGFGGVGQGVARRLLAARAAVVAVRRSPRGRDAAGAAPGLEVTDLAGGLARLAEADAVVLALPLTAETRGLFAARELGRLKDGAYLVNVARGELVDEAALERELPRLGGAGLDVFQREPLPPEHPFWRHPQVLVTPHVARSPDAPGHAYLPLFERNLAAFVAGRPLEHVVDKERGY